MFFALSKIGWALIAPSNLVALSLAAACVALLARWVRSGTSFAILALLIYGVGILPLGNLLLRPLEDRFPRPPLDMPAPAGIIVLGGGMNEIMLKDRGALVLTQGGSRMTDAVILARRYPEARVVFSGGSAALITDMGITEADAAQKFLIDLGLAPERLLFERKSRNTDENARFTRDLVQPKPGETWLLVTSAFHMPRSVGLFRKAGFSVVPWPSDYVTRGNASDFLRPSNTAADGIGLLDLAVREWIGLGAYRLAGKIDEILPAP
jgi:uncharacterized SAM-binding protein YcdF (DUF218 family)